MKLRIQTFMKTKSYFFFICLMILGYTINAQVPTPPVGYEWVKYEPLSDEFDSWDNSKWMHSLWNYAEPNINLASQAYVEDGKLCIRAEKHTDPDRWMKTCRVQSLDNILYPIYSECSMKAATLSGYNTFWFNNGNAENRDEIDICENNIAPTNTPKHGAEQPYTMQNNIWQVENSVPHSDEQHASTNDLSDGNPKKGVRLDEEYHTLGVYWPDANNFYFYLDGEHLTSSYSPNDYTRKEYINFDFWTHSWGGYATEESLADTTKNTMRVDWVHTYKLVTSATEVDVTPDTIKTSIDQQRKLYAQVLPEDAYHKDISWNSTDTNIVKVDQSGFVVGVSIGQAYVKAITTKDGFIDSCLVEVQTELVPVSVDSIVITPASAEITEGKTKVLNATIYPPDAVDQKIIWSSSDTNFAKVDSTGMVTAISAGMVFIKAENSNQTDEAISNITITAKNVSSISGIKEKKNNLLLYPNPANEAINIKGLNNKFSRVRLISLQGSTLQLMNTDGVSEVAFEINELPAGIYFIEIENADFKKVLKFQKL